jgi:hypothetical protein
MSDVFGFTDEDEAEDAAMSNGASLVLGLLNSKAVVALITVALGGLFTIVIADLLQRSERERSLQTAWLHERAQHRILAQRTFLDEQQTAVEQAYRLIGRVRSGCQAYIDANSDLFDDKHFTSAQQPAINVRRVELRDEFNAAGREWEQARAIVAYQLADYPSTSDAVSRSWRDVETIITKYQDCIHSQAVVRQTPEFKQGKRSLPDCSDHDTALVKAWDLLGQSLRTSRGRVRWEWEQATVLGDLIHETSAKAPNINTATAEH